MRQPRFVQMHQENNDATRAAIAAGLMGEPAQVDPKYFYDALGSRLFDAITELPEYYPTRLERGIFEAHRLDIASALGTGRTLVDLGAGSCQKAASWFDALAPKRYVAVDISVQYLEHVLRQLQREHLDLDILGLGLDFAQDLNLPADVGDGERLMFYPGSSIGNFNPEQALKFLQQARVAAQGGALLIGVDLVKDKTVLEAAYDDPLQVTAAFNRNLLRRLNVLLGCNAALEDFTHVALFNEVQSRIEMHLQASRALTLRWPGGARTLAAGERIHTENSYKYRVEDFDALLREAGFVQTRCWTDERRWFAVFTARA